MPPERHRRVGSDVAERLHAPLRPHLRHALLVRLAIQDPSLLHQVDTPDQRQRRPRHRPLEELLDSDRLHTGRQLRVVDPDHLSAQRLGRARISVAPRDVALVERLAPSLVVGVEHFADRQILVAEYLLLEVPLQRVVVRVPERRRRARLRPPLQQIREPELLRARHQHRDRGRAQRVQVRPVGPLKAAQESAASREVTLVAQDSNTSGTGTKPR